MKAVKINNKIITASIDSHWSLSKTLFCWTDFQPRLFNFCVSFLHKGVFEIWDCSKWMDNWQSPDFSFALNSWNITSELLNLSKKAGLEKGFLNLKHSDKTCKVSDICADDLQQRQPVHTVTSRDAYLIYFLIFLCFWTGWRPLSLFVDVTSVSTRKSLDYLLTQKLQHSHKFWFTFLLGRHALLQMLINKTSYHESKVHTPIFTAP